MPSSPVVVIFPQSSGPSRVMGMPWAPRSLPAGVIRPRMTAGPVGQEAAGAWAPTRVGEMQNCHRTWSPSSVTQRTIGAPDLAGRLPPGAPAPAPLLALAGLINRQGPFPEAGPLKSIDGRTGPRWYAVAGAAPH